jgi:hypothetical protein
MTYTPTFEFAHRRLMRWLRQASPWALGLALLLVSSGGAQKGMVQQHPMLPQPIGQPVGDTGDLPAVVPLQNEKALRALNADRQKSLVSDANKLLQLVNELNAEIARTSPASLTLAQLRKVAEVEKLAHNVKDKMSTSVRGMPAFEPPFQPVR